MSGAWDAMIRDTTPWVTEPAPASPEQLASMRLYDAWKTGDGARAGVMARHAWNAAWAARGAYEQQKADGT